MSSPISSLSPKIQEICLLKEEINQKLILLDKASQKYLDYALALNEKKNNNICISTDEKNKFAKLRYKSKVALLTFEAKKNIAGKKTYQFLMANGNPQELAKALYTDPNEQAEYLSGLDHIMKA